MSLKIKLSLFIVLLVFIASSAILAISVYQTRRRGGEDIARIRTNETARVKSTIKEHVDIMYSLIGAQYQQSFSRDEVASLFSKIKDVTYDNGRGYFWISDLSDTLHILIHPHLEGIPAAVRMKLLLSVRTVNRQVRGQGEQFVEADAPVFRGNAATDSSAPLLCYGRVFAPLGWVIASGRSTDDIDATIAKRSEQTEAEIASILRERIILASVILALSILAAVFFTGMVTGPINKLVCLTEEITSERKGFSERIVIRSRDEIGRLADSFNLLLGHIQATLSKLEENGRNYRELVENANSAIIRIEKSGTILFVNEYAQDLFGFSTGEIHGKSIRDIFPPPVCDAGGAGGSNIRDILDYPERKPYFEDIVTAKNGEPIWVAWTNRPIYDDAGNLREILFVGSDITARKKAEHLAHVREQELIQTEKMATLGTLVSGIAHEINNPNNFIILNGENFSDMLNDILPVLDDHYAQHPQFRLGGLPYSEMRSELPGLLHGINEGALRIKRIVGNLKDFSRREPGEIDRKIRVRSVIDAAAVILGNLIRNSTNKFEVIEEAALPPVKGNFQRLEQVVINLVTNACQATRDKEDPVTVTLSHDSDHRRVLVAVEDCGAGIPPENLKYIMDPFFTTKRDIGGTGLGLAISYSIIKEHGGDLRIESAPGRGTKAIVTLLVY
jgi:PAS domain S-box-containing protein